MGKIYGTEFNGPVYVLAKANTVMGSAAEAKVGGLYMNAVELSLMRTISEKLDHSQPPTPIQTDDSTADGIMIKTIKQKTKQSNGQTILLATRQSQAGRIQSVLGTRQRQSRRLLHQIPLTSHTQKTKTNIYIHRKKESDYLAKVC